LADKTFEMGKLLTLITLAVALVYPGTAGAEFKRSGNLFAGTGSIIALTELGWFIATSQSGAPLDLRTFDLKKAKASEILSFFLSTESNKRLSAFVTQGEEKKAISGAAYIELNKKDAIALSSDPGAPLIAMSGEDILVLLGPTVLLNARWQALVQAIKTGEEQEAYSLASPGKLIFSGVAAGSRIGVSSVGRPDCGESDEIPLSAASGDSSSAKSVKLSELILLWRNLYLDPATERVYVVTPTSKGEGMMCLATEILHPA